jgi:hypothetical protein
MSALITAGVISALISAFVALLIKWLAKPRLNTTGIVNWLDARELGRGGDLMP